MLKDLKPILLILARFLLIYIVLLGTYQFYLNYFNEIGLDPYSRLITDHVMYIQNYFNYPTQLYDDIKNNQIYFWVKNDYRSRMVEGCNAISVIILFISFVFAFYKGAKTFVFVFAALILFYIINVLRIAALNIVITDYPKYDKIAHDYIFPAVIYGTVVLLWIVWMKFFALREVKQ